MLTDKEKRLIKHYYLLSSIRIPAIIMTFITLIIWSIFVFIENHILNKETFNYFGINIMIIILIFYIILFSYSFFRVRFGVRSDNWTSILDKQNITQHNTNYSRTNSLRSASNLIQSKSLKTMANLETMDTNVSVKNNIKRVVDRNNIKINTKKYILAIVLIPTIILFSVYIPSIIQTKREHDEKVAFITNKMETLENTFKQNGYNAYYGEIDLNYSIQFLSVYSYNSNGFNVSIDVSNDGNITRIIYYLDIDKSLSNKETIEKLYKLIQDINDVLLTTKIGEEASDMFVDKTKLYEIASEYLNGDLSKDYYNTSENGIIYYTFSYLIEDYNEDYPFIYFDVSKYY